MDDSPFHGPIFDDLVARGVIMIAEVPGRQASLRGQPAQPMTDLERSWFTDDELALRREVGEPRERSLVENLGICALGLISGAACMVSVAIVGFTLFDLLRWLVS